MLPPAGAVLSLVTVKPAVADVSAAWLVAVEFCRPVGTVGLAALQL
jgi:hypothetical protein